MPKPVLPTKHRRKGFESVRKGDYTADARPLFFEKELLYCKLTVASDIWKELLHVSLGAVEKCCRSGFIKGFSFFHCLAWIEKVAFSAKLKTFLFSENLPKRPQKQHFFANQTLFIYTSHSFLSSNTKRFYKPNAFYLNKPFLIAIQATLFHPPSPIPTQP